MDKTIFSKYSNDRGDNFKIRTDICLDSKGNRYVKKHPMNQLAKEHIAHILDVHNKLQDRYGNIVGVNECSSDKNGNIIFPYILGSTLDEKLNIMIQAGDKDGILELIDRYKDMVEYKAENQFIITDEFKSVFGEVELPGSLKSTDVADIDLIFENILIDDNVWNIIDYEWTFLFPVPVNFIIYRALAAFVEGLYSSGGKNILELDLYKYCGISSQEIIEYKKMIEEFEKYVMQGGDTMKVLHGKISQKVINPELASKIIYNNLDKMGIQIFPDFGSGYDEDSSYFVTPDIEKYGDVEIEIDIPDNCQGYRIDPAMDSCILNIDKVIVDGEEWKDYSTNGFEYSDNAIIFDTDDSQIYIKNLSSKKKVTLSAKIVMLDNQVGVQINDYAKGRILDYNHISEELIRVNKVVEEYNQTILDMNKMADEQNDKVADLYKQLENLYIEKNAMEEKYTGQITQLAHDNQEIKVVNQELNIANQQLNAEITNMKNTKVWRMYSKYQKVRDKINQN